MSLRKVVVLSDPNEHFSVNSSQKSLKSVVAVTTSVMRLPSTLPPAIDDHSPFEKIIQRMGTFQYSYTQVLLCHRNYS